jgi:putative salt-induced outer membrane protein YdiY
VARVVFALACAAAASAHGDEVRLRNGDRLTGEITAIEAGKLSIKVPYAGNIKVDIGQVDTFETTEPVSVLIDEASRIQAIVRAEAGGKVVLEAPDWLETEPLPITRLTALTRKPEAPVTITGRANAGISSSSGNTSTQSYHLDAEVIARSVQNRFTAGVAGNRKTDHGVVTESNSLSYLKYDHFLSKQWYAYANTNAERDPFKDIRLRTTLGAGTGYQFIESEKTNLSVEGGVNYVNTDRATAPDESFPAARAALKYDHFISEKVQLFLVDEAYVDLKDRENGFLRTQTGIRVPLGTRLTTTLQYNVDWDASPAPGLASTDRTLLFTLGYFW